MSGLRRPLNKLVGLSSFIASGGIPNRALFQRLSRSSAGSDCQKIKQPRSTHTKSLWLALTGLSFSALAEGPAAAAGTPSGPGAIMQVVFLGGFVLIFYFLVWPRANVQKEHRELVGGLNKGDEVIVNGGLAGRIVP